MIASIGGSMGFGVSADPKEAPAGVFSEEGDLRENLSSEVGCFE